MENMLPFKEKIKYRLDLCVHFWMGIIQVSITSGTVQLCHVNRYRTTGIGQFRLFSTAQYSKTLLVFLQTVNVSCKENLNFLHELSVTKLPYLRFSPWRCLYLAA